MPGFTVDLEAARVEVAAARVRGLVAWRRGAPQQAVHGGSLGQCQGCGNLGRSGDNLGSDLFACGGHALIQQILSKTECVVSFSSDHLHTISKNIYCQPIAWIDAWAIRFSYPRFWNDYNFIRA